MLLPSVCAVRHRLGLPMIGEVTAGAPTDRWASARVCP